MSNFDFDKAAAHADLCRLLAACYYEPGPEFGEEKVFDSIIEATRRIDDVMPAKAQQLKTAFESETGENLLVDYAKLFLGPNQTLAPPYESAWRDINSASPLESTQALVELYEAGGFEMDPGFCDLPDHIAVELEFLYTLLFRIAAAAQNKDQQAMEHALALRWPLIEQHLGRWLEDFQAAVHAGAQCRFYSELVDLTVQFVGSIRND